MKYVNLILTMLFLMLWMSTDCFARISLVVFPFKNLSNDELYSWISSVIPETAYRSLFTNVDVRLYDPVFIFQTDSTCWEMNSDSLLIKHKKRWRWNAAIGGNYTISSDSVYFNVRIFWSSENDEPLNMEFSGADNIQNCRGLCSALFKKVFTLIQVPFPERYSENREAVLSNSLTAYKTFYAGYLFEMKGNIAAASTAYARALEIDPDLVYAGCRLGRMLYLQQKYDDAKKLYERFLNKYPDQPMISAFMIEALSHSNNLQSASQIAGRLKNSLSKSSKGLCAFGHIHLRQGEVHRAISLLSQAKASGPENLDVEFYLGQAFIQSGDYERAIDIFNQLIRYCPDFPVYYSSLAAAYKRSGQLMQASIAMQSALSKSKNDVSIMIDLSQIWIEMKWFRKAIQILDNALEINPDIPDIYVNKAIALWHTGDITGAKKILYFLLKYHPSVKQTALINIGNIHFYSNDYRKALSFYKKAYAIEKLSPSLEYDIALSYHKIGKLSRALYHYDQFLALSSDDVNVIYRCADISISLKRYDEAVAYLKRIIESAPQDKSTVKKLCDIYLHQGKLDDAVKILDEYLAHSPSNYDLTLQLAFIYTQKEWFDVALQKYQEIIRDYPELADGYLGLGICMMEQIKNGKRGDINNVITALKFAAAKAPAEPTAELLLGDLYFNFNGDKKTAIEYWNKALKKTTNEDDRKKILKKINTAH